MRLGIVLVTIGLTLASCEAGQQRSDISIYGGSPAHEAHHNIVVALRLRGESRPLCSGVILSEHLVLTAGHCLKGREPTQIEVLEGNDLARSAARTVEHLNTHPQLDRHPTSRMDYGYLVTHEPLEGQSTAKPLSRPWELAQLRRGREGELAGFGSDESGLSGEKRKVRTDRVQAFGYEIRAGGAGKDACHGDSGGPLWVRWNRLPRLAGIVSRGETCGKGGVISLAAPGACWAAREQGLESLAEEWCPVSSESEELCTPGSAAKWTLEAVTQSDCLGVLRAPPAQLDFSGLQLTRLHPAIAQLRHSELDLSDNPLSHLPDPDPDFQGSLLIGGTSISDESLASWNEHLVRESSLREGKLKRHPVTRACLDLEDLTDSERASWRVLLHTTSAPGAACAERASALLRTTHLSLSGFAVEDASMLGELSRLRSLDISGTNVENIESLQRLMRLTSLDLRNTPVADFSSIQKIPNLRHIRVERDRVSLATLDAWRSRGIEVDF